MKKLEGIAASPGIVIGRAYVVHSESFRVFPKTVSNEEVEREIEIVVEEAVVLSGIQ